MATPVKTMLLIGISAVWWVFKVKVKALIIFSFSRKLTLPRKPWHDPLAVFEPWHKAYGVSLGLGLYSNESLKNH